ncbi:3-oxoacyl-[acyl-carrier-protein] synthase III C-terminal domain-containing protein [Candidatus Thiothrix sp. Deng01]|uniref:3-oxoacyl-[acyl-carrier-protein] synthase III C-terminal domain-containing protein n=1 Tax=Candidatus Thiothrix phosphatis TaxID=3112415 RepID=A0ABU6CRI2_9GAMM|nr:3-oxoacyl-[acyl-carrier-protein] synthase III C-terminal domain-containing protein [Candidatus Thiothrix sp. Deng01]MEB4589453.1 3-oxoacyl-[acyl-carrier-protein] synthase III C-terminal domain-containing protein [Candidatus Thiothrix sp. Deng01]
MQTPPACRHITLLGTGHAVPTQAVTSAELDRRLGLPPGTIQHAGGVRQRHFAAAHENAASIAAKACQQAFSAAHLPAGDIDCLVAASGTLDQGMPCNAALIHRELGLGVHIPAFDVNMSCLSFLAAFDTLSWPIAAGRYQRVLVVAADIASCGLDWQTLEASAIFGDGAAAAILASSPLGSTSRILASDLLTVSEGAELCQIPAGGSRFHPSRIDQPFEPLTLFRMDGKRVFKLASQYLPGFLQRLLQQAGLTRSQIDWVVPHQASHLALAHLSKRLGFPAEKVINIFADYGNQIAASLPTALDVAIRDGRIQRGHKLLLLGTGAGLSLGGMVLEY